MEIACSGKDVHIKLLEEELENSPTLIYMKDTQIVSLVEL